MVRTLCDTRVVYARSFHIFRLVAHTRLVLSELEQRLFSKKKTVLTPLSTSEILKYRADYNNNPPTSVAFMPAIASTSGRLHSEFIRLLFLQAHRETDRFFAASGVQLPNIPVEESSRSSARPSSHSLSQK